MKFREVHILCILFSFLLLFVFIGDNPKKESSTANQKQFSSKKSLHSQARQHSPVRNKIMEAEINLVDLKSKLVRGKNKQLLYSKPSIVNRTTIAGKTFDAPPFQLRKGNVLGPLSLSEHSFSAIDVEYDEQAVKDFIKSEAEQIIIPLSEDRETIVNIDKVLSRGTETHTLIGKVPGRKWSDAILVFHDGTVSGSISFYDKNEHYKLATSGDGFIAIRHLDPKSYTSRCACSDHDINLQMDEAESLLLEELSNATQNNDLPNYSQSVDESETTTIIDSVVGYGREARIAEGGTPAMEARILESVDRTNLAFANSGIMGIEYVLAATIEDPDYVFPGQTAGSMSSSDELGDLRNESDGILDVVTNLKNAIGADHSAFILKQTDGSAGIAGRPGDAMIVARTYMSPTRITFVHELGHNIGCQHAWGDTGSNVNNYNYGWRINSPQLGKVRSVMSYDWSWQRIPYFSNPNIQYGGANTGAVDGYDATNDPTADPRAVAGGDSGTAGAGYDGTNPNLGARNADYIQEEAQYLADNADRTPQGILVFDATGAALTAGVSEIEFNVGQTGDSQSATLTIQNSWVGSLDNITVSLINNSNSAFSISSAPDTSINFNESTTFSVEFTPLAIEDANPTLRITSDAPNTPVFDIQLLGFVRTVINEESFEQGLGVWANTNTELDWTRDSNGTPSSNTGPASADDGTFYMYTEASSNFNKTAHLEASFDLSSYSSVTLEFSYHMYGSNVQNLFVDVFNGSTWVLGVWEALGQQQTSISDPWQRATLTLNDYTNANARIRFRSTTGPSFRSDVAIDDIFLFSQPEPEISNFAIWATTSGLQGSDAEPMATPQGDQITNLMKYAFNIEASSYGAPVMDPTTGQSGLPYVSFSETESNKLSVVYMRRTLATDLTYTVQFSNDMTTDLGASSWTEGGVLHSTVPIDSDWERVTVIDTVTQSTQSKRFGRVKVSLQE